MKGRIQGRPTKLVTATVTQQVSIGKPGVTFEIWEKWKKKRRKLGTLTVSVGGLRWWPNNSPKDRKRSWKKVRRWFEEEQVSQAA